MKIRKPKVWTLTEWAAQTGGETRNERFRVDAEGVAALIQGMPASGVLAQLLAALKSGNRRRALALWAAGEYAAGRVKRGEYKARNLWRQFALAVQAATDAPSVPVRSEQPAPAPTPPPPPSDAPTGTLEPLASVPTKRTRKTCPTCGKIWYVERASCPRCTP